MGFGYRYSVSNEEYGIYDHCQTLNEALDYMERVIKDDKSSELGDIIDIFDRFARKGCIEVRRYKKTQTPAGEIRIALHDITWKPS